MLPNNSLSYFILNSCSRIFLLYGFSFRFFASSAHFLSRCSKNDGGIFFSMMMRVYKKYFRYFAERFRGHYVEKTDCSLKSVILNLIYGRISLSDCFLLLFQILYFTNGCELVKRLKVSYSSCFLLLYEILYFTSECIR